MFFHLAILHKVRNVCRGHLFLKIIGSPFDASGIDTKDIKLFYHLLKFFPKNPHDLSLYFHIRFVKGFMYLFAGTSLMRFFSL